MAEKINQKEVLEHINKNRERKSQKETGKDRERETHTQELKRQGHNRLKW